MPTDVPPDLINGLGVVGIVVAFFWMLATGRIVTRREADDIRHDRDEWRAAHRISETARQVESDHVRDLLEQGRVQTALLRGFSEAAKRAEKTS
jgi:hypothetical protein